MKMESDTESVNTMTGESTDTAAEGEWNTLPKTASAWPPGKRPPVKRLPDKHRIKLPKETILDEVQGVPIKKILGKLKPIARSRLRAKRLFSTPGPRVGDLLKSLEGMLPAKKKRPKGSINVPKKSTRRRARVQYSAKTCPKTSNSSHSAEEDLPKLNLQGYVIPKIDPQSHPPTNLYPQQLTIQSISSKPNPTYSNLKPGQRKNLKKYEDICPFTFTFNNDS